VSGWWLIAAEVLAVVILLILADVTGRTARGLSQRIDNRALADLARSDPDVACINGAEALSGWRRVMGSSVLTFAPVFRWPNGTYVACTKGELLVGVGLSNIFQLHNSSLLLDEMTLAAMYRCGILTGFAMSDDAADAIENGCAEELPHTLRWRALNNQDFALLNTPIWLPSTHNVQALLIANNPLAGFCDCAAPQVLPGYNVTGYSVPPQRCTSTLLEMVLTKSPHPDKCFDADSSPIKWDSYLWQSYLPSEVSLFFAEDTAPFPQMVVRLTAQTMFGLHRTAFLWFGPQNESTSACMVRHATHDVDVILSSGFDLECHANNFDLSLSGIFVKPVGNLGHFGQDSPQFDLPYQSYACAGGIDITSPNASAALAKLSAYKDRAKAGLTTVLFWSMRDQTYDDVYAVYTGILGALFGAFALLVTTLFVYALAAVKRTCACFQQPAEPV
jgi:hypothetical protein